MDLGRKTVNEKEDQDAMEMISEIEKRKINLMRDYIQRQDPSANKEEVDDFTLRRFLRARDLEVEKGSALYLNYKKWRQSFVPKGFITASEVPNEIGQRKMFLQGRDKKGHLISVVLGAKHFQSPGGVDEFKRFLVFALDRICARMGRGQEKFVVIGDLAGWGYQNSDIRCYLAATSILQDYYPERLGKVYLVHVPYIFMAIYKLVCPFIDEKTKKKIVFVENKKLKQTLLEEIEESQIPEIYGGQMPLVPIQDS